MAAFLTGAMLQLWASCLLPWPAALALLIVAAIGASPLLPWRRLDLPAALALGLAVCALHGQMLLQSRLSSEWDGTRATVTARVVGLPEASARGSRFVIEVIDVLDAPEGAEAALSGRRFSARWFRGGGHLQPGEVWRWSLRFDASSSSSGPGQGDPARRALMFGWAGEAVVQSASRPVRLSPATGVDALRAAISQRIAHHLGTEAGRFVAALAVGDVRGLSDSDWEQLRRFGLTHLIAISGFHVGIVAGLGVLGVRLLWWLWPECGRHCGRAQAAPMAALLVAIAYAALAGFSLPTVRTVLMIAVVALLRVLRRQSSAAQGLVMAMAVVTLVDPFSLLSPGFWLSCGGVAWLMWCLPGTTDPWNGRAFLKAQWVATLGLMPIAAAFFLQVPVAGPLANLLAIPWISLVVVPLSLLGTLLMPVSDLASMGLWRLAAAAMDGLWALLEALPEQSFGIHWIATPSTLAIALAVLGVAIGLLPRGLHWRHLGWVLVLPLLFPRSSLPDATVEVVAFNLPRGDAVLIRSTDHVVLVDAGPATSSLVNALRSMGLENIDLRIETRGNSGRLGGAAAVDAALPPTRVWRHAASSHAAPRCEAGQQFVSEGFRIDALSPEPGLGSTQADGACVLRLTVGTQELWLSSDAGRWVARRVATAHPSLATAQVWGAPAALLDWRSALGAEAVATRAPGPSRARDWPAEVRRVDLDGQMLMRFSIGTQGEGDTPTPIPWREGVRRWWDVRPP